TCGEGHHPFGCLCKDSEDIDCAIYTYGGLNVEIIRNIFEECKGNNEGAIDISTQIYAQIKINNNMINQCSGYLTGGIYIRHYNNQRTLELNNNQFWDNSYDPQTGYSEDALIEKYNNYEEISDAKQYFKSLFNGSISNQLESVYYSITKIGQQNGWFSLTQAQPCNETSDSPETDNCICRLSQSQQECACSEVGDLRNECSNISKTCDDSSVDLIDIPPSLCPCNGDDDPRIGITCSVTTECSNISISPKCLCTSEHQSPGCICTQTIHPQECICDQSSDALFSSNICSTTKTCSGSQGDDEQITQGQCTCGFEHHPSGCLCKDSEDIDCICPSNFGFNCTCRQNVSQTTTGDNIKSTIQAIIDLTSNFLIKGHETIGEQAQTIWSKGSGQFSLNQGIKTCTGGSAEEPTPKGCICNSTQSEQECACQEYDQRQSCICLIVGDPRTHCIEITIPSCDQATSNQLIDVSTDICECYSVGDPRDQCSSKSCDDAFADLSNIPPTLCSCNNDDDPRRGITCPVINECTNDSLSPKCLCTSEHQSPGCICTQSVHPQDCICDQSSDSLFQFDICSSTKTCSGSQGDDEQITQGQCTCGFEHHPSGCLCKDSEDINCFCNLEFSPIGCTCPSNSEFICTCRWNGRETIEEQAQTIWSYEFNYGRIIYQRYGKSSGSFSLNQAIKTCTGGSAEEPTPKGCICQLSQSEQECECQDDDQRQSCICLQFGDPRIHCIGHTIPSCDQATPVQLIDLSIDICECYSVGDLRDECQSKSCDDPFADLSNIPPTLCSCNNDDDPRRGITCPVTTDCTNDSISPKCLCTSELQSPGCICTQSIHPQDCECDQSSDSLFQFDICSSTKTCSGSSGDDEQITQGQCTCGFGHHPSGCLCKDSEDINCFCNLLFSPTGCTCPSNSEFICTCHWNVSQTTTGDNIKSTIQSVIDLTCDNYEIQLIDSQHFESINISKQGNIQIKGRETTEEQTQTIWRIIETEGRFSLNQAQPCNETSDSPETDECICKLSQSQQECACQEYDQRESCICLPIGDPRTHCIGHTIPCESASKEQLIELSTDICGCVQIGDPRDQCSSISKTCDDPSAYLSNVPISRCECNGDDDPRRGITCPVTRYCSSDSVTPKCLCTQEHKSPGCICTEYRHPSQCICDTSDYSQFDIISCEAAKQVCTSENPDTPDGCTRKCEMFHYQNSENCLCGSEEEFKSQCLAG
ncbi:MAG: hypothetical protein EZS28_017730, partial [Streblomastix strix]